MIRVRFETSEGELYDIRLPSHFDVPPGIGDVFHLRAPDRPQAGLTQSSVRAKVTQRIWNFTDFLPSVTIILERI